MSASYNLTHNLTHAPIRVPSDDGLPCSRCTRVHTSLLILHINWYLICMSVQHHRVRCTNAAETHRFCLRVPRVLQSPLLRAFPYLLTVLLLSSMDASRQVQAFLVAPIMATGVISGASLHGTRSCSRNGADEEIATLSPPVLELITPDGIASSPDASLLILSVKRAVAGGVSLVQLRDYESDEESKTSLALDLLAATRGQALFVFNGEPDAARACGAHGVHLPERMMSRMEGLRDEGQGKWPRVKGCSVHSVEAAVTAARLGADYVQVLSSLSGKHIGRTIDQSPFISSESYFSDGIYMLGRFRDEL